MKAVSMLRDSFVWYALATGSLLLVIGELAALAGAFRVRRNRRTVLFSGLNLLAGLALFTVLMDCARYTYLSEPDPRYRPFQLTMFSLPWGLYAGIGAVLAVLLAVILRNNRIYLRDHLTADSVRETVDLLPEGICISAPDGTVLLSNLQMNAICRTLTGSVLSDANRFRKQVEAKSEQQDSETLVRLPYGETRRFSLEKITVNGKEYDLLIAADVTEQYRITEELREKNEHLQDIRRRMKAVTDISGDLFFAREKADARAALHNQLGQVLLTGRHYLEHPDSTDGEMVRMLTREMNRFLLREAEIPTGTDDTPAGTDLLQQTLYLIRGIGIRAEIDGKLPEEPARRTLLAYAVQECATNAVKHAEADRLTVRLEETGESLVIRIANNGRPPKEMVTESGGLLSLRRKTEEAGGEMAVESVPAFRLTIRIP
ncbi:MAG: hypothetical protein IKH18_07985 [Clostridia bacterium]|nr:hypothetical protein [Clostridia bacterium]